LAKSKAALETVLRSYYSFVQGSALFPSIKEPSVFLILIGLLIYFGLGIALMFVAYRRMAKQKRSWRTRIGVVVAIGFVVWAIPYGDHTLGKIEFKMHCAREAGLRIYRTVSGVEGFRSPFASGNTPRQLGYNFVEEMQSNGKITRHTLQNDGRTITEAVQIPISRYAVDRKSSMIGVQISRGEYSIIDLKTNEKLAEYVQFGHLGGWFARQLAAMHAYRSVCPPEAFSLSKLIRDVLRPRNEGK
jgi:hypothetical protein